MKEFRVSDHSASPLWIMHLTYSAHFHILSLIWCSSVYFYHKVYLHIIHIYNSSLIKWNQQNFHRHCISISYNPILSTSLLALTYLPSCFAIIVQHSSSFFSFSSLCVSDSQIICPKDGAASSSLLVRNVKLFFLPVTWPLAYFFK